MKIPLGLFAPLFIYFLKRQKGLLGLFDLGTPLKIKYFWNLGSLLGVFCLVQVIRGLLLRVHFNQGVEMAFISVNRIIQREVFGGWLTHKLHRTGASFFFVLLYIHFFRGFYYGGFNQFKIWVRGVSLLLLSMAIAFFGYVLPWGQMSF